MNLQQLLTAAHPHITHSQPHFFHFSFRIRTDESGGAWCPEHQVSRDVYEWIQVDLHVAHVISAVESQGRYGRGNGLEYAPNYLLEYWRPGLSHWVRYKNRRGEEVRKFVLLNST